MQEETRKPQLNCCVRFTRERSPQSQPIAAKKESGQRFFVYTSDPMIDKARGSFAMRNTAVPFPEDDWKTLRRMMPTFLERASAHALERANEIVSNRDKSAHERYLELVGFVDSERQRRAKMFDDIRRSTARMALANMVHQGIVENEEFAAFTKETREKIEMLLMPSDGK